MYQLRILVGGKPIPVYHNYRDGTNWVEAREGTRYEIEVKNNSYNRILAVVSIDGLNIINGKHEKPEVAPGYVLNSYMAEKVPGWKVSQEKVREFYFTRPENSYSKKLGADQGNIGVIAAAIFKEKPQYTIHYNYTLPPYKWENPDRPWCGTYDNVFDNGYSVDSVYSSVYYSGTTYSSGTTCSCSSTPLRGEVKTSLLSASVPAAQLGTGSGEKVQFETVGVTFGERVLETVLTLYYDSKEGLQRRGIWTEERDVLPKAFPSGSFCPDL
ncbi:MAG TPA: hypothetical protein VMD05_05170 [Candidatus Nanoarchaeia archaeon]|nr:hypothetical protein [Candidatus Nanoarchaeia archaeon]